MPEQPIEHEAEAHSWQQVADSYKGWDNGLHPYVEHHLAKVGLLPLETETALDTAGVPDTQKALHGENKPTTVDSVIQDLQQIRASIERDEDERFFISQEVIGLLKQGDYSLAQLGQLVSEFALTEKVEAQSEAKRMGIIVPYNLNYYATFETFRNVPEDKIRALYFTDDIEGENPFRKLFDEATKSTYVATPVAEHLQNIYELDDVLSLKSQPGIHQEDERVSRVTARDDFGGVAMDAYWENHYRTMRKESETDSVNWAERSNATRDWGDRYLEAVVGLPADIRDDIQFASYERTINTLNGFVNAEDLMNILSEVNLLTHQLGLDTMRQLHDQAGINNFDYYSARQLKEIAKVINKDEATISHLQAGDVTLVLTDATGDHNGAFQDNSKTFETPSGRTLFFEINRPSDFYRYMILLKENGIQPSTLVVAAHGDPGVMGFGKSAFNIVNDDPLNTSEISIATAKGLPRLVSEYMQDSRGIDDNVEAIGRRRIILQSCSQAKPSVVYRQVAEDSYFRFNQSMAETLAVTAAHPNLDVYAGSEPLSVVNTETGFRMNGYYDIAGLGKVVLPLDTTRLSMDSNGNIIESRLKEVVLRPEIRSSE